MFHEHHPAHLPFARAERAPQLHDLAQEAQHHALVQRIVRDPIVAVGEPLREHLLPYRARCTRLPLRGQLDQAVGALLLVLGAHVALTPPPHPQHMSFELKSASSYPPHQPDHV